MREIRTSGSMSGEGRRTARATPRPSSTLLVKALSQRTTPGYTNQYAFHRSDAASNRDFEPGFEGPTGVGASISMFCGSCFSLLLRIISLLWRNHLPVAVLFLVHRQFSSSHCYYNEFSCKNRSGDRQFSLFPACYQGESGRQAPFDDPAEFASPQARMEPRRLEMCERGRLDRGSRDWITSGCACSD